GPCVAEDLVGDRASALDRALDAEGGALESVRGLSPLQNFEERADAHHHVVELMGHGGGDAAEAGDAARFVELPLQLFAIPDGVRAGCDVEDVAEDALRVPLVIGEDASVNAKRPQLTIGPLNAIGEPQRIVIADRRLDVRDETVAILFDDV